MTVRRTLACSALIALACAPAALAQGGDDKAGALLLIPLVPLLGAMIQLSMAALFPSTVKRLSEAFRVHLDATLGWAALASVLVAIVCGLASAVGGEGGKAFAGLVFAVVFLLSLGGAAGFTLLLGRLGLRRDGAPEQPTFVTMLVGSAIVFVASQVPLLGQLAMLALLFVSVGAVIRCTVGVPRVALPAPRGEALPPERAPAPSE